MRRREPSKDIRGGDSSSRVREDLSRLEEELQLRRAEARRLEKMPSDAISIPPVSEIKAMAGTAFCNGEGKSRVWEGHETNHPKDRCLSPPLVHRRFDRATCAVSTTGFQSAPGQASPAGPATAARASSNRRPVRSAAAGSVPASHLHLRAGGMTQKEAADQCGLTVTAAQDAARLQRRMDALGLTDAYVRVTQPPDDYG